MGSIGIAGWIAHAAFWTLLLYGAAWGQVTGRGVAVFLILWVAGLLGLLYVPYGAAMFSPFVAVLDIVLVFVILEGDVRIS